MRALRDGDRLRALALLHCTDVREALRCAVTNGSSAIPLITELLRNGASATDALGDAASSIVVHLLVRAGADPNGANSDGVPALLWAAGTGQVEVVVALLETGASVHLANETGENAIAYAAGTDWGNASLRAGRVISELVEYGANVDVPDVNGRTPLHKAAEGEAPPDTLRVLLVRGANPNARTRCGETPVELLLHSYETSEDTLIDKLAVLIQYGATRDAKTSDGKTYCDLVATRDWTQPLVAMAIENMLRDEV